MTNQIKPPSLFSDEFWKEYNRKWDEGRRKAEKEHSELVARVIPFLANQINPLDRNLVSRLKESIEPELMNSPEVREVIYSFDSEKDENLEEAFAFFIYRACFYRNEIHPAFTSHDICMFNYGAERAFKFIDERLEKRAFDYFRRSRNYKFASNMAALAGKPNDACKFAVYFARQQTDLCDIADWYIRAGSYAIRSRDNAKGNKFFNKAAKLFAKAGRKDLADEWRENGRQRQYRMSQERYRGSGCSYFELDRYYSQR
ncbi:MAG: hypothetical protein PHF67_00170 [Candidatus Nanoarchaeia archaeon]|nr:hypothetical protein [Candidatus Nanoarchaeia archaeon]